MKKYPGINQQGAFFLFI